MRTVMIRSNPVRPDSRVEKEAYTLKKAGHDVKILCWDRDCDHRQTLESIYVADIEIPIVRLGFKAGFGLGKKSIVPFSKFQFSMWKWLIKNRNSYDCIHACDFDTAFTSSTVARFFRKKFIFDIFDFIGEDRKGVGRVLPWIQYKLINFADATIICTEERRQQIKGSKPKHLTVIHNTPFSEQLDLSETDFLSSCKQKIKVAYVGILQDYRLLLEIGDFFLNHSNYEFHIGGFGKYEDYFRQLSQQAENIKFYGKLTYSKTLQLECKCDIMLAIYDPTISNHKFAAPNKFYESLMLGKPVIMVHGTGMSNIVTENDIGILIDYSKDGFACGLEELSARKAEWPRMSNVMKQLYERDYSWNTMADRLINLYQII